MMGFIFSASAVLLTAWIVYIGTRRAAYLDGFMEANQQWRRELDDAHSDDPRVRYIAARFSAGVVPAGTPKAQEAERARLARVRRTIRDDPGHSLMCDCDQCLRVFGG